MGITEVFNKPMAFEHLHKLIWMDFCGSSLEEYKRMYEEKFKRQYVEQ